MENVKEKKGFFDFLKPKPKPMGNTELQAELKIQSEGLLILNTGLETVTNTVKSNFETLIKAIEELKSVKSIPDEWIKTITEMKTFNPDLPDVQVCYDVLMAYKNLGSNKLKKNQEQTLAKITEAKKTADGKKIRNCGKCNKPVAEGEYYKIKDKAFCLEHKGEVANPKTPKPNSKSDEL